MRILKWIIYAVMAVIGGLIALIYLTDDDPHRRKRH